MISKIKDFFSTGNERSIRAKKNIVLSLFLKGVSILISILLVPLTLHYLNPTEYGIWLTLSSVLGWISFFDIGLGNGLRNKFAEAKAVNDHLRAKSYVSTAFAIIVLIMLGIFILFLLINPYLDWTRLLNTDRSLTNELNKTVFFVFLFFCIQFIFKLLNVILLADQKTALSDLINLVGSAFSLIIIYLLTKFTSGSLFLIGFVFSISPLIILIIIYFWLFNGVYKNYKPSIKSIKFSYTKDLMGLGIQFFVVQISCLIVFTTSNIIISQLFNPASVTQFNIAFKYFSILIMIFNIITSPFWSAYTEAYFKKDLKWISNSTNKLIMLWILFTGIAFLMVVFANNIYQLWVGPTIRIPIYLSISMGFYAIISNWNNIFINFINGVGKIRLQLYNAIFVGIINIPLSIFLGKKFGVEGVVISTCICLLTSSVWAPIQYNFIMKGKIGLMSK